MGAKEHVQYIRENFQIKYAENIASSLYDIRDVERLQNDETFARSYIRGPDRLDEGVDLVHSSFKFRNEMKVNDLREDLLPQELLGLGVLYFHGRDNNKHRILWVKVKFHRKDVPAEKLAMEKMCLIYALEKAFNAAPLEEITFLLDMTSCGLVNMDIDYVKFIITIFKFYYPTFLAYMLIYDMPWIFNAAWKVIKTWLSAEAAALIKFVTKEDIRSYINPEDLPPYMGGTDTFEFSYKPGMATDPLFPDEDDMKKVHFKEAQEHSSNPPSPGASISTSSSDTDSSPIDAAVRTPDSHRHRTLSQGQHINRGRPNNITDRKQSLPLMHVRSSSTPAASTHVGRLLTVSPADELIFHVGKSGESSDVITLTNTLPYPVAFKVKTTSPEKFRVRPSSGLIKSDKTEEVYISLVPDQADDLSKDKFLIMAIDVQGGSADLNQLFKDAPRDKVMQHKLKCSIGVHGENTTKSRSSYGVSQAVTDPVISKVEQLETQIRHMQKQMNLLLVLQFLMSFTLILVLLSHFYFKEELFSHVLVAPPLDVCHTGSGNKTE